MRRTASLLLVLSAVLVPLAAGAHGHGGGSMGSGHGLHSHGTVTPAGPRHLGVAPAGSPRGPMHRFRPGPAHFISGGPGFGWWFVGGAWIPWTATVETVPTGEAFYCQSLGAWFPAVQACPEDWLVVVPALP